MIILNKITGRDVTTEYLGLLEGLITNEEFEVITMTLLRMKTYKYHVQLNKIGLGTMKVNKDSRENIWLPGLSFVYLRGK
tara:strand:+ start:338 stop:577 length:240 start_codon:yes stop_codon:yes gene_type:complete